MTSRERIDALLRFEKVDRLPVIEWAPWWNLTVQRWRSEGLPESLETAAQIRDYFGLDRLLDIWGSVLGEGCPMPPGHGLPIVHCEEEYMEIKKYLYPTLDPVALEGYANAQAAGAAVWFWTEGFFWHPRTLLGIEEHLYAFYDKPELLRRMNEDLLEYLYRTIEHICQFLTPQFVAFGDDMSYNHGPMISREIFDGQLKDFYVEISRFVKSRGIKVFVDSDGLVDEPVEWYRSAGCEGFLPLEKQAGVDLIRYRQKYPDYLFLGGFDKMCMDKGEDAMRSEFERLLPVMRQGGYILGVDHQTPPEVSMQDYQLYLRLLWEYCELAAKE